MFFAHEITGQFHSLYDIFSKVRLLHQLHQSNSIMTSSISNNEINSPLLGYNTNVRHSGKTFHIQTEDSGVDHPHIITHLFTSGTILATKKISYADYLDNPDRENIVRKKMKTQHKAMFLELRDGIHDDIATQILGIPIGSKTEKETIPEAKETPAAKDDKVQVIQPASMAKTETKKAAVSDKNSYNSRSMSIFESPGTVDGTFGDSLISDKSLDEVILTYLKDDLDE